MSDGMDVDALVPAAGGERVIAAADLCGRAGARSFEIGYTHDGVPMERAGWYAHAAYRGARITAGGASPWDAAEALAVKLLTGARCSCGRLVALADGGALAFKSTAMTDGSTWTAEEARAAGQCRWRREGPRWVRACDDPAFTRVAGP